MSTAAVVAVVASYLLGSVSFAVVVSRLMGLADPRSYGSGNPGATNVLRTGNKVAALLTLLGDALKGSVAVALVQHFGPAFGLGPTTAAVCGLAAFLGHLYPVFFGFQGGKGVATFLGVVLVVDPVVGLFACGLWLLTALALRYSSLASMVSAALAPLFQWFWAGGSGVTVALAVMSAVLILRHRQNIANLLAGRERRIGQKAAAPPPDED